MEYCILICENEQDFAARTSETPETQAAYWGAYNAYIGSLREAGILSGGNALQGPHTGTSIRHRGDKRMVQDGPFADAKEQLGGFLLITVADLDTAMEWASRCPSASTAGVEVRPTLSM